MRGKRISGRLVDATPETLIIETPGGSIFIEFREEERIIMLDPSVWAEVSRLLREMESRRDASKERK